MYQISLCLSYYSVIAKRTSIEELDTGCLGLVHWDDPEGLYGEGGRRGVQSLGQEDALEKKMAAYSSTLA